MDILSPRGQVTRQQEERAVAIWLQRYPSYTYIQTPKDKAATVDAVLSVDGVIKAVVETKCRNMSLAGFEKFKHQWLVTYEKVAKCADIASALCVPFVGFLYLVHDDVLLYQKIWEPDKGFVCDISICQTLTRATVNGGNAVRANAFIDMTMATVIKGTTDGK